MRIAGIIAEYDPFHKGHAYHIAKTKEFADAVVVVLGGELTQRGEPAWCSKNLRTKCALACGADLVLELPAYYACASAERFAGGGVAVLSALGCVDFLSFGSECGCSTFGLYRTARPTTRGLGTVGCDGIVGNFLSARNATTFGIRSGGIDLGGLGSGLGRRRLNLLSGFGILRSVLFGSGLALRGCGFRGSPDLRGNLGRLTRCGSRACSNQGCSLGLGQGMNGLFLRLGCPSGTSARLRRSFGLSRLFFLSCLRLAAATGLRSLFVLSLGFRRGLRIGFRLRSFSGSKLGCCRLCLHSRFGGLGLGLARGSAPWFLLDFYLLDVLSFFTHALSTFSQSFMKESRPRSVSGC